MRFIPVHPHTIQRVREYLARVEHGGNPRSPLFWPVKNPSFGVLEKPLAGDAIYRNIVQKYARELGIEARAICVHGPRATAATNALDHSADIAKVQEWLGHSNISTTRLYDRRKTKPEESPTFMPAPPQPSVPRQARSPVTSPPAPAPPPPASAPVRRPRRSTSAAEAPDTSLSQPQDASTP